jgi:uncharacterized protein (TIGR00299 family) protein
MRIAILDPAAGISGDMTLGALIGAGLEPAWLEALPGRMGFPDVAVRISDVERAAVRAVKVDFDIPDPRNNGEHGHGRTVEQLMAIVRSADLDEGVRERAIRAFDLLGEIEGRVHGVAPRAVHLHEVGAVDAVLDIVGAIEGFARLGVAAVYNRPVALGSGWVDAAHGALPVPAPATLDLLAGLEVASDDVITGEATTPTGAVLLRVMSQGAPPARWRVVGSAWGAGSRNPGSHPNALRLILAETVAEAGMVEIVATDVDDLSPEYVEPLRQALFDAGAVDCQVWPTQGKKGRVSLRIEALAPPDRASGVSDALLHHSTTTGVRRGNMWRTTVDRWSVDVELEQDVRVRVKVWDAPAGRRCKAEYEDVVSAARALDRPAWDVARHAERLAAQREEQRESKERM